MDEGTTRLLETEIVLLLVLLHLLVALKVLFLDFFAELIFGVLVDPAFGEDVTLEEEVSLV